MDITPFLRELLFGHDCVIVPGFGGFIGNYSPARVDKSSYTFYPPVKLISFNRNLNHNDGLLIGRISDSLKVNYGDARNIIDEFVQSSWKKLEKGEKIIFDNIGSFILNHEGSIQFEPDTTVNYHLDSFGLESFQFNPAEGYDVRKRITRHIDKEPASHNNFRKILWRAAIIVPLAGLLIAVPLKTDIFKSKVETSTLNPLATAEFEENRQAVEALKESALPVVSIDSPAEISVPASTPEISAPENYRVITGSFRERANAELQVSLLEKEGFVPEIIDSPNGFFRVSAMRCNDLNTALARKDSIIGKFPGSWVKKI